MFKYLLICMAASGCAVYSEPSDSNMEDVSSNPSPNALPDPAFYATCKLHLGMSPQVSCAVVGPSQFTSGTMPCQLADISPLCVLINTHSVEGAEGPKHIGETICIPTGASVDTPIYLCPK